MLLANMEAAAAIAGAFGDRRAGVGRAGRANTAALHRPLLRGAPLPSRAPPVRRPDTP